jgi:hypothetical protein
MIQKHASGSLIKVLRGGGHARGTQWMDAKIIFPPYCIPNGIIQNIRGISESKRTTEMDDMSRGEHWIPNS